jgi:hypothetical protein
MTRGSNHPQSTSHQPVAQKPWNGRAQRHCPVWQGREADCANRTSPTVTDAVVPECRAKAITASRP